MAKEQLGVGLWMVRCFIKKEKRLTPSFVRHLHWPGFRQEALAVSRVALTENGALTVSDVGFGKVSKHWLCLDTFSIHPCAVVTFHEPVAQLIEWLGKLVHEPLGGS